MYACPHCNAIDMFMAFKDGVLIRVLEDHEDVEGVYAGLRPLLPRAQ